VKPRIPLPTDSVNESGLANTAGMAPALGAARRRLYRTGFRMRNVDPVTTELVRIRNARFQSCNY
jgi:hypothetical protein